MATVRRMRRMRGMAARTGALFVFVLVLGACSTTGADDADRTDGTTATAEADDVTTTTTSEGTSGAAASWDDVLAVVDAEHGTMDRTIGLVGTGNGEPLFGSSYEVAMRFDADQELLAASIEVPEQGSSGGGTLDFVYGRDEIYLHLSTLEGECDGWIPMGAAASELTGFDIGSMLGFPPAPFDQLAAASPEGVPAEGGATTFEITIPATLLVSNDVQREYPDVWADLEQREAPATVTLDAEGTVSLEASLPGDEVIPEDEMGEMLDLERYEMLGTWELTASDEPLGLEVPTDLAPLSCLDE